jgi:DNA adenine methylase
VDGILVNTITSREAALRWGIPMRNVTRLCCEGKISGAVKVNGFWQIPKCSELPVSIQCSNHDIVKSASKLVLVKTLDSKEELYKLDLTLKRKNSVNDKKTRSVVQKPSKKHNEANTKEINSKKQVMALHAEPFIKWAGGKTQILNEIRNALPNDMRSIAKYAEPFVGGGAVLFDMLDRYSFSEVYISDVNRELVNTYAVIRDNVNELIDELSKMSDEYLPKIMSERKKFYYQKRERYNLLIDSFDEKNKIEMAALFIFLNHTCFNGLYRVNSDGHYNVPSGVYESPTICDSKLLLRDSIQLKNVKIVCGDYHQSSDFIDEQTFVYFDPPYRPITKTSEFTSYTSVQFDDSDQRALADYVHELSSRGAKILVSNSDPKNTDYNDNFFENLYSTEKIVRIGAKRAINSKGNGRGKISELLISNY